MEIAIVAGMILAFVVGAYVRQPWTLGGVKKQVHEGALRRAEEAEGRMLSLEKQLADAQAAEARAKQRAEHAEALEAARRQGSIPLDEQTAAIVNFTADFGKK